MTAGVVTTTSPGILSNRAVNALLCRWGYDRAAELLVELYRTPHHPLSASLLWASDAAPGGQGSVVSPPSALAETGSDSAARHDTRSVLSQALLALARAACLGAPEIRCANWFGRSGFSARGWGLNQTSLTTYE